MAVGDTYAILVDRCHQTQTDQPYALLCQSVGVVFTDGPFVAPINVQRVDFSLSVPKTSHTILGHLGKTTLRGPKQPQ